VPTKTESPGFSAHVPAAGHVAYRTARESTGGVGTVTHERESANAEFAVARYA
jgi:hypothetical protein